jgi:putative type II/III system pilus formation protein
MVRYRGLFVCGSVLLGLFFPNIAVQRAAAADAIRLKPGYVSLIKLDQTVGTIVIGNPDVVDATLQGKNAILLTAKKIAGSAATNIIVLNSQDAEIFNATIIVGSGGTKTEIHSKGKSGGLHEYWAYRCTPACERVEDKLETFQRSAAAPVAAPVSVTIPSGPGSSGSDAAPGQGVPQY